MSELVHCNISREYLRGVGQRTQTSCLFAWQPDPSGHVACG